MPELLQKLPKQVAGAHYLCRADLYQLSMTVLVSSGPQAEQVPAHILGKCRTRAKHSDVTATGPEAAPQTTGKAPY